jgi:hypothetical protein
LVKTFSNMVCDGLDAGGRKVSVLPLPLWVGG